MNVPAWILVTWFVSASTPEHYGYKGYESGDACITEVRKIMEDITKMTVESATVSMTCVPTYGRDPDTLTKNIAVTLRANSKVKQ